MTGEPAPEESQPAAEESQSEAVDREPDTGPSATGDRFELSGDFRGAVINIKSTLVGAAEVKDIEDLPPKPGESPFLGLQYFDEKDAHRFFGRELLTAKIVSRLHGTRLLAVIGASGSGKSSLVRAGVIPALRRGERLGDGSLPPTASRRWRMHIFTPTAHPMEALAATLLRDSESVSAISALQTDLAQDPRGLVLSARKFLAQSADDHLLLVIDQFEEIFTLCRHPEEREAFIANLLAAAAPDDQQPITVLLTLRADFYSHLAQHDRLREVVSQQQEFIGAMSREELFRAIVQPAALGGWKIQEGLVEVMLDDAGGEPGALPLLSHALLETWKRRRGITMTLSGYTESGGVRGAIAQTAEAVFQQRLTPEQRPVARMIFVRLAELGEDSHDTRRRADFSELITRSTDELVIQAVINILAEARLITTGTLPPGETQVVEVAHEALIREWPTLREWLDENREGLILHRQLTADTNDWLKLERDPGALYRGARLGQMQAWAEGYSGELSLLEQEFLDASRSNERQEIEQAQRLRRATRLQRALAALAGILSVALVTFLLFSTGVIYTFRQPARMEGIYNLAVAEIGLTGPDGVPQSTTGGAGERLSGWLAGYLKDALEENPNVWVWQDGPEIRRQNVKIGRVAEDGDQTRVAAAGQIAERLGADMLVYGDIDARHSPAQLTLEFWIVPQDQNRFEEILGSHRLTTPVPILNPGDPGLEAQPELKDQASTLAWIAMGLTHAQLGQTQAALEAFQKAEGFSPQSEVVQFFLGREYLFLVDQQPERQDSLEGSAEQAFTRSVSLNPDYARGFIGLGGVYFKRAQRLLPEVPLTGGGAEDGGGAADRADLSQALQLADQAIAAYQSAIDLEPDPAAYGVPVDSVARLGLGKSYRLKASAYQQTGEYELAGQLFDQAIGNLEATIQPFGDSRQERYLAQAYEGLGNAYHWRANLLEIQQQYAEMLAAYHQAVEFYDRCIAQADATSDLIVKNEIAGAHCVPYRQEAQKIIDNYSGEQG